jgi:hypothetical protein
MSDTAIEQARVFIAQALNGAARATADPESSTYRRDLAARIADAKPCLIPSWLVLDIVAAALGRAQ